ncbi:hypothetical protein AAG570_000113 [Ranatra chinensis]|uniref:ZAD domain-containing protein n=1 Tax=Ranatra chinensis TaxID=642074 RepID=A0ABD0YWS3_9HEMI
MQLKLRVGVGETITIDVEPTDTFQDLSDRLYLLARVQVDLSQLKSNDKPFDMSTNVIQYFTPKSEAEEELLMKMPKLCRLCSESISHDPQFLFEPRDDEMTLIEKVNATLPIHVTARDQLPKQICTSCLATLNNSYDFMMKVLKAQKCLENVYNVKEKDNHCQSSGGCCPLCMVGRLKTIDGRNKPTGKNIVNNNNGMAPPPPPPGPNKITSTKETTIKKEVVVTVPRNSAQHKTNNSRFHGKSESLYDDELMDKRKEVFILI